MKRKKLSPELAKLRRRIKRLMTQTDRSHFGLGVFEGMARVLDEIDRMQRSV